MTFTSQLAFPSSALGLVALALLLIVGGCTRGVDIDGPYVVVPDDKTATVTARLIFGHDAAIGPGGTAWLTARAIEKSFSSSEASVLNGGNAVLKASATREALTLDFTSPKASFPSAGRALANHLANLPIDDSQLENLQHGQLVLLNSLRRDAAWLANSVFWQSVFQGGQCALPAIGSDSSVAQIHVDDVRKFLGTFITKDNYELGLSGPISDADASKFASDLQELLPPKVQTSQRAAAASASGLGVQIVEVPGLTESTLLIGFGAPHTSRDSASMALAMAMILETSPSFSLSGMDQSLRVERGLVDAIDAGTARIETASPHVQLRVNDPVRRDYTAIKMQLAPVNALYAAKIVIKELVDLDAAGIGEADITRIQQLLARADSSTTDAVERMKSRLARRWMGLDTGMRGSKSGGTGLTSVRVRQLLRSALDPANLWIVAVVPEGERFRAEILGGMTAYVYPDWVDRREIRRLDQEYLSYRPFWQADKVQVLRADSLFR